MTQRLICITGATGGLGKALVREAISRGHSVRAVGRDVAAGAQLSALGAQFIACDLEASDADLSALTHGCDSIIHAAALSTSWGTHSAFVSANIEVTAKLIEAAQAGGVSRFVFVSSPSIFARCADQCGIAADDPPNPQPLNSYAQTKLAAERLVLSSAGYAMACTAIRPRALVGEGDTVILPRLTELASRPRVPLPGGGEALIELTDLRDAAWAICEAEERAPAISGHAINISGGAPQTVRSIAERLAETLGKRPRMVSVPLSLAKMLAHTLESIAVWRGAADEPALTRYTLATLGYSQTFDLTPARRLLGYEPRFDALATLITEAGKLREQEITS